MAIAAAAKKPAAPKAAVKKTPAATAAPVAGVATGKVSGNALHWTYVLRLPVDGKEYEMAFDDWMWQLDDRSMMNRSTMSKFGIEFGEVTLFFRKRVAGEPQ